MPARFDASWRAWKPYDSFDVTFNGDGNYLNSLYGYDPAFVSPRHWNPIFSACASSDGGSPLVSFQWGLWRGRREIDTAKTSYCMLTNSPSDPPDRRLDVPTLGSYFVTLSVTNLDGKSASTVQEVTVRDLLVVSFGDSSASGEGNKGSGLWEDARCHRSRTSGPALAAKYLEYADPKTSVTYLDFACSGASVPEGIIGPYKGEEPAADQNVPLEPQTDALVRAICGGRPAWRCQPSQQRSVDILTINIGVNDLRFADLLADCDFHACLAHHWDTALPNELADFLKYSHRPPSCKTAQQRFDEIPSNLDVIGKGFARGDAVLAAGQDCDTARWGHSFQYIADRLRDEGVTVAETYLTTYPVNLFSGDGQPETTGGCDALAGVGPDEAAFMTGWGDRLNTVITDEAVRLGWYPVVGLPQAFRGHGYCAETPWFVHFIQSDLGQGNKDGTAHPNGVGHAVWASRFLAAIAAPKPSRAPTFTVRVHLRAFRMFLLGIGPEGNNGSCNGNSVSGVPVKLLVFASLSEAGFDKPAAEATYQVTLKPVGYQFQPSEWYQFPGDAVLTFPLSSVDRDLYVFFGSPLCITSHSGEESVVVGMHRLRHTSDGSDLAGAFQLRSSPGDTAMEVSGSIDVVPAEPLPLHLRTGPLGLCQQGPAAPLGS